ncbi:hypothetical protein LJC07_04250 [Christensenellaceae bacterium OttesenSCG-928-L17]|nr:hypothetical protein [Christensenellaceae bacterium OttesenSCG-928-L17]
MWNESRKQEFLSSYKLNAQQIIIRIFNLVEELEIKSGMDLCEFSDVQMQEVLSRIFQTASFKTTQNKLTVLRGYLDWCVKNGFCERNVLNDVYARDAHLDDAIRNTLVRSPRQLALAFEEIFRPVEELSIDNMTRLYLWIIWCGIHRDEALKVRHDDIDLIGMEIQYGGNVYQIPKQAFHDISAALDMPYMVMIRHGREVRVDFSDYTLAVKATGTPTYIDHYSRLRKGCSKLGMDLTTSSIAKSGMLYRLYRAEKHGDKLEMSNTIQHEYRAYKRIFWEKK